MSSNSGIINSKNWPLDYPSLQDCYWKIEVGDDKGIKIAFMDFDLEYDFGCDNDKVKVKGEKIKRQLCKLVFIILVVLKNRCHINGCFIFIRGRGGRVQRNQFHILLLYEIRNS